MKIVWPDWATPILICKTVLTVTLLVYIIHAPIEFFHHLMEVLHIVYESIAFVIEEFLHHVFHFNKFQSQLFVFYFSWALALYGLFRLWQRLPEMIASLKNNLYKRYFWLKTQAIQVWKGSGILQKIKLLLIHFGITFGAIMFFLT
jgi:hypothetical protein